MWTERRGSLIVLRQILYPSFEALGTGQKTGPIEEISSYLATSSRDTFYRPDYERAWEMLAAQNS